MIKANKSLAIVWFVHTIVINGLFGDPCFVLEDHADALACQGEDSKTKKQDKGRKVPSQTPEEMDMSFVPTKDGMNPRGEDDTYEGPSLLRYSSEVQEINKDIDDIRHMKKLPVGQMK